MVIRCKRSGFFLIMLFIHLIICIFFNILHVLCLYPKCDNSIRNILCYVTRTVILGWIADFMIIKCHLHMYFYFCKSFKSYFDIQFHRYLDKLRI